MTSSDLPAWLPSGRQPLHLRGRAAVAIDDLEDRERELTFHPDDVNAARAAPLLADVKTAMRACVRVLEIDVAALAGLGVEHRDGATTIRIHNCDDDPVNP